MKEVEVKVLNNKMKVVKEENVAVRIQLKDPSLIKRAQPQDYPLSTYEEIAKTTDIDNLGNELIPEFERVQKNFDLLGI